MIPRAAKVILDFESLMRGDIAVVSNERMINFT